MASLPKVAQVEVSEDVRQEWREHFTEVSDSANYLKEELFN